MTYGFKRWALGYLCGSAAVATVWIWSVDHPTWATMMGMSIVLFFADYLLEHPKVDR